MLFLTLLHRERAMPKNFTDVSGVAMKVELVETSVEMEGVS